MNQVQTNRPESCSGACEQCSMGGSLPPSAPDALAGGRMVLASASVFLLPLATAIAGALWIRSGPSGQLTGALAGFAAGVAAASILTRFIRRHKKVVP